jgi:hypothetical protein
MSDDLSSPVLWAAGGVALGVSIGYLFASSPYRCASSALDTSGPSKMIKFDAIGTALYKRAKEIIPGGTQLLSKRPEMFLPDRWPSYYRRAKVREICTAISPN